MLSPFASFSASTIYEHSEDGGFEPITVSGASFYPLPSDLDYDAGPGKFVTDLLIRSGENIGLDESFIRIGEAGIWNGREDIFASIHTEDGWLISQVYIYIGYDPVPVVESGDTLVPTSSRGTLKIGEFPYIENLANPTDYYELALNLEEEFEFTWGKWDRENRVWNVAIYAKVVKDIETDHGKSMVHEDASAFGVNATASKWGWWTRYLVEHPETGHFIDAPVAGVDFDTSSNKGKTDTNGAFDYIPGETVTLSIGDLILGNALAMHKITPMDLVGTENLNDVKAINMARILQSLDNDQDPKRGIFITQEATDSLNDAMEELDIKAFDFENSDLTDTLINLAVKKHNEMNNTLLRVVSMEEAKDNLEKGTESDLFRKNISKTPELLTEKAKLELMMKYVPARKANGDSVILEYYDENEVLIGTRDMATPLVTAFADEVAGTGGAQDVFVSISRDDGNTWLTTNVSKSAGRSSFTLQDGTEYPGDAKKPQIKVRGNYIFVAWTSTFARSGKPTYAIDPNDDYTYDDPYYEEDIFGVAGPQRSIDYTDEGYPEVGEIPYSVIWTARGVIDETTGDITWFKAERLTSGRRDANQVFMGGFEDAGFALVWQEDPEGLRPGEEAGPGEGWSGATTNHKTDIWYSYIKWDDFAIIDENFISGGVSNHADDELFEAGRQKALVPMSMPVRISDNDVVNMDNVKGDYNESTGEWSLERDDQGRYLGTHSYGALVPGLYDGLYTKINNQDAVKEVFITEDGRLLDGDTGASRPNIMMQKYTKTDGSTSAFAVVIYEETKGVGAGPPENTESSGTMDGEKGTGEGEGEGDNRYYPDMGKNVIYHTFDFTTPDLVSAGEILNPQSTDADGNPLWLVDEEGNEILDWQGNLIAAYENARRPRLIIQSKNAATSNGTKPGTVLVCVFKMGEEGKGRPSDIFMRRWVVAPTDKGNPYQTKYMTSDIKNISSVDIVETAINLSSTSVEDDKGNREPIKVIEWEQTVDNLNDLSSDNPYDDARAHRGFIKGDFLAIAYDWTPNWAPARNGNDHYDLYVRRSFNGGETFTTDPKGTGVEYETINTRKDPNSQETGISAEKVTVSYGIGEFEPARNLSMLPNHKESVIEPRLVGVPGTFTGIDDDLTAMIDIQNPKAFWVTYGTESNPQKQSNEMGEPLDIYYSYSTDRGETYFMVEHVINPESAGNHGGETVERWDWLAKDTGQKVAAQAETQIRMSPSGSVFYAVWNETGLDGSDAIFRKIMRDGGEIISVDAEEAADLTLPQITILGVTDGEVTGDDLFIKITLSEAGDYYVELTKNDVLYDTFESPFEDYYVIKAEENTDKYHLEVFAEDLAGNRNRKGINFTVDKRIPIIDISGVSDGDVSNESFTININVTGDETNILLLKDEQEVIEFESGSTVSKEGAYELSVVSISMNSGFTSEEHIGFIIDKTPPSIVIEGIENDSTYYPDATPVISIEDNFSYGNDLMTEILLNDDIFASGTIIKLIGRYTLNVTASDQAGNTSEANVEFKIMRPSSNTSSTNANTDPYLVLVSDEMDVPLGNLNELVIELNEDILDGDYFEVVVIENQFIIYVPREFINNIITIYSLPFNEMNNPINGNIKLCDEMYFIEILDPEGNPITEFEKDLIFKYTYCEDMEDEINEMSNFVCYMDEIVDDWVALPTEIDLETNTITAYTDHLSAYTFMNLNSMPLLEDINGHWAEEYILRLASLGLVKGDPNGKFRPDDNMTREEFTKLLMEVSGLEGIDQYIVGFKDEAEISDWARTYVNKAVEYSVVNGYLDNTLRPKAYITKAETATMITRMFDKKNYQLLEDKYHGFSDVPDWAVRYVSFTVNEGIMNKISGDAIGAYDFMTRAQVAEMLNRYLEHYYLLP